MRLLSALAITTLCLSSVVASAESVSPSKSVQLTVYNGGFALVKDVRNISLTNGVNSIEVEDVAAQIDPTSVLFRSLTAPNSVSILEQNYQYDLMSPAVILDKSVGKKVTITRFDESGKPQTLTGTILNVASNGGLVVRTDDGKIVLHPEGQVSLDQMPEGLHPKPVLNWMLQSQQAGEQQAEVSYITNGIGWKADYVALVNTNDTTLDLSGWVTLNNNSGVAYKDAKLTLMAGDVRRVRDEMERVKFNGNFDTIGVATTGMKFEEKSFFEYHIYTMQRPTTIRDKETKQLSLLNASGAPVTKELIYDGRSDWWRNWWYPGRTTGGDPGSGYDTSDYHKVNVVLEVKNSKENHMGMPLPAGKIRVYKLDSDGSQQFIGEDTIDHTPKDERIRMYIGDSFDVVGDYKRTNYSKISNREFEESFQVNIRNHKDAPVNVKVVDHVWDDWKVTQSSQKYDKKDAHTIEFPVAVPANGETVVTYTIRTKW